MFKTITLNSIFDTTEKKTIEHIIYNRIELIHPYFICVARPLLDFIYRFHAIWILRQRWRKTPIVIFGDIGTIELNCSTSIATPVRFDLTIANIYQHKYIEPWNRFQFNSSFILFSFQSLFLSSWSIEKICLHWKCVFGTWNHYLYILHKQTRSIKRDQFGLIWRLSIWQESSTTESRVTQFHSKYLMIVLQFW